MMREIEDRLRARLNAVERETESLRSRARFYGVALTATLALLAIVAVYPDILATAGIRSAKERLEVRHLVLLGPDGAHRGDWAVDADGNARLHLLDRQGRARLSLTVLDGGFPGLSLSNADGQRRAVLGLLSDGTNTLVFADEDGRPRAVIGMDAQRDAASFVLSDADGVPRVGMGLEGTGEGSVILPEGIDPTATDSSR
jgi:hypothetical protein